MLQEINSVKQKPDEKRRWFQDDYFDLIVWFNNDDNIIGFQICYDISGDEQSLTWKLTSGFEHHKVDSGQKSFAMNKTPILIPDGLIPLETIRTRFLEECKNMDYKIVDFIVTKLNSYNP